ncbi:MAG: hypothetical protein Q9166_001573 [cf. Caloplaca sp. 2 TL-2023]
MKNLALFYIVLSLPFHVFTIALRLPEAERLSIPPPSYTHYSASKSSSRTSNLTTAVWPPCPYRFNVRRRKGNQFILVTKNDREDHGESAKRLAIEVCDKMIAWLSKLPQGSRIETRHWEHKSYGEEHAEEFSIFMDLVPSDVDSGSVYPLDREIAYFAFKEYANMIGIYGAMRGILELHAYGKDGGSEFRGAPDHLFDNRRPKQCFASICSTNRIRKRVVITQYLNFPFMPSGEASVPYLWHARLQFTFAALPVQIAAAGLSIFYTQAALLA